MALFYYYGTGDLGNTAVRLGTGFMFVESADLGTLGMGNVDIDDPTSSVSILGLHPFHTDETSCSQRRLFSGYFADRGQARADSLRTGAARRISGTLTDLNAALQFEVIRNAAANRPAETDIQRITWWLSSGFTGPIGSALTFVDSSGPVDLDASDYRGRNGADLMSDCSQQSGKNYFVSWDPSSSQPLIHYYAGVSTLNRSTLKISNVLADVDQLTVYCPDQQANGYYDPSTVYSGVYLAYGTGVSAVYQTNGTTEAAIGHKRETSITDPTVSSSAKATAKANTYLADSANELVRITVTLTEVPPSKVGLIRAGQAMQVKFTHLDGFSSYTWIRVSRCTVQQQGENQLGYRMTLELSNSKVIRGRSKHGPPADQTDDPPDATTCDRAVCGIGGGVAASNTIADGIGSFSFGGGALYAASWLSPNVAYTVCGCALGCGGYGPGQFEQEIWMSIDSSGETAADTGILVTIGASTPTGAASGFIAGIGHGTPTSLYSWEGIGGVGLSGGTVFIPRSALSSSLANYLVLAPAWHSGGGFLCAAKLISPCGGPVVGGEAGSGKASTPSVSAEWQSFCSDGFSAWVPGIEEVDGSTRTFTLIDWTAHGTPQARVGALIMAADSEYTIDRSAGTVTFKEAPPAYSQVAFRYMVQQ